MKRHFKVDPKDMLPNDKIVKIEVTVEREGANYMPGHVYSIVRLGSDPFNTWYVDEKNGESYFMDANGYRIFPGDVDSATEVKF